MWLGIIIGPIGGYHMQKPDKIDFTKLLGFETVADQLSEIADFQDETLGAKLGAKVGEKPVNEPETKG
jgi:hypothetical protein